MFIHIPQNNSKFSIPELPDNLWNKRIIKNKHKKAGEYTKENPHIFFHGNFDFATSFNLESVSIWVSYSSKLLLKLNIKFCKLQVLYLSSLFNGFSLSHQSVSLMNIFPSSSELFVCLDLFFYMKVRLRSGNSLMKSLRSFLLTSPKLFGFLTLTSYFLIFCKDTE